MLTVRPALHPVCAVLRDRKITYTALARLIGRSTEYTRRACKGFYPASPAFRCDVALALDLPEDVLFHPHDRERVAAS